MKLYEHFDMTTETIKREVENIFCASFCAPVESTGLHATQPYTYYPIVFNTVDKSTEPKVRLDPKSMGIAADPGYYHVKLRYHEPFWDCSLAIDYEYTIQSTSRRYGGEWHSLDCYINVTRDNEVLKPCVAFGMDDYIQRGLGLNGVQYFALISIREIKK